MEIAGDPMEQFIANGLCKGATYSLVALGFGIIYTTSRVFHIAHAAIYVATSYALYLFLNILGLPLALAVFFALVVSGALGILIELLVYRALDQKGASSSVLMISSLGVYIILVNMIAMFFGSESRILRTNFEMTVSFGHITLTHVQIAQFLVSFAVVGLYWIFLESSPLGRTCRAVADDSVLAAVLGVKVKGTRLVAIALGSLLAGIGSILVALDVGMEPYVGFPVVMVAAVSCIIGGLHRFIAPALGGVLLGLTQSLVVWRTSAKWESAVTFTILIAFLLLRPQGLLGMRKRLEER
jgi:branched-chain amino acid transport system permease protein